MVEVKRGHFSVTSVESRMRALGGDQVRAGRHRRRPYEGARIDNCTLIAAGTENGVRSAYLYCPARARADYDKVYITSKSEVIGWAERQEHKVRLPKRKRGLFKFHAFVVIREKES